MFIIGNKLNVYIAIRVYIRNDGAESHRLEYKKYMKNMNDYWRTMIAYSGMLDTNKHTFSYENFFDRELI